MNTSWLACTQFRNHLRIETATIAGIILTIICVRNVYHSKVSYCVRGCVSACVRACVRAGGRAGVRAGRAGMRVGVQACKLGACMSRAEEVDALGTTFSGRARRGWQGSTRTGIPQMR